QPEAEIISVKRRPPAPDPDEDTGDLPSPAVYQKMVVEYMAEPPDENRRREVEKRLEDDSMSANSAVRYYAVEAMAQLNSSVFKNALLAATDDEDEAVRMIAVQALRG
ncbi:MAG: HEAT repeat domain-containing protein, partial [Pseudomonadota bacterium]